MAESNYSAPLQSPFPMPPNPPGLRNQDAESSAPPIFTPSFSHYGSFSSYDSALSTHPFQSGPYRTQLPEPHGGPFHYLPQNRYPALYMHAGPRLSGHIPPPPGMFQHGPSTSSGLDFRHFHSAQTPSSSHLDYAEARNTSDLPPMIEPAPLSSGLPPYNVPPHVQLSSPPMHGYSSFLGRRPVSMSTGPVPPAGRFGVDAAQPAGEGRGVMRGANTGSTDQVRHAPSPGRRMSYERQHLHAIQAASGPERRASSSSLSAHPRRSDRSVSPRISSNRRSFDRYSTDLTTSTDADEIAARARVHRRQARLRPPPEFRSRIYAPVDNPNVPSHAQMQVLKDKLRHFLPSELPEGSAAMCDICQKDYSTKYVQPTEEEEVAIQLPCKHVFGEFCINTWFETCKTHKNKITCPMCRKLLIEPAPTRVPMGVLGADMLAIIAGGSSSDRRALEQMFARDLEGDLAHI